MDLGQKMQYILIGEMGNRIKLIIYWKLLWDGFEVPGENTTQLLQ